MAETETPSTRDPLRALPPVDGVGAALLTGVGTLLAMELPLLTREQVADLAFWAEAGQLAKDRLARDPAGADTHGLRLIVHLGEQSVERLIRSNLRLVTYWINRSWARPGARLGGLDTEDLEAAGLAGLIRAVHKFDYRLGWAFSTYASGWIRQAIARAVSRAACEGLSGEDQERLEALFRTRADLWRQHGRSPSVEQIAAALQLSRGAVIDLLMIEREMTSISLDQPVGQDPDAATLGDLVPDSSPTPELMHEQASVRGQLSAALAHLTARQRAVVTARVGWDGPAISEEEVAARYGVTTEAVRAVVEQALAQLRGDRDVQAVAA